MSLKFLLLLVILYFSILLPVVSIKNIIRSCMFPSKISTSSILSSSTLLKENTINTNDIFDINTNDIVDISSTLISDKINDITSFQTSFSLSLGGINIEPFQIVGALSLIAIPIAIFTALDKKKRKEEEDSAYQLAEIRARQLREEKEFAVVAAIRKKELEKEEEEKRLRLAKELQEESERRKKMDAAELAKKEQERKLFLEAQAKYDAEKKEQDRLQAIKLLQQKEEEEKKIKLENERKAEEQEIIRRADIAKSRREQEEAAERDWKIKEAALKEATAGKLWKAKQLAAKSLVIDKQKKMANLELAIAKEKADLRKAEEEETRRKEELAKSKREQEYAAERAWKMKDAALKEAAASKAWKAKQVEKSRAIASKYSNMSDKIVATSISTPVKEIKKEASVQAVKTDELVIPMAPKSKPTIETVNKAPQQPAVQPVIESGSVSAYKDPNEFEVIKIPIVGSGLSLDDSLASLVNLDEKTRNEIDKKLNEALTILAKMPVSRLKSFILQYKPEIMSKDASDFENIIKLAAETGWSRSNGDYEKFVAFLDNEFKNDITEATKWMRVAVSNANELNENRLKDLIAIHGGRDVTPIKRKGEKLSKADYLSSLLEILRNKFKNDYREVAMFLGNEKSVVNTKKGFGKK